MANYLPAGSNYSDTRISPAKSGDFAGLAPAIIVTAGHDPLHDQGLAYANLLSASGIQVFANSYDRLAHGFTAYTGGVPAADTACREIAASVLTAYRQQGH